MSYAAPVGEIRHMLDHMADLSGLMALPAYNALDFDLVDAVLEEAAKLSEQIIAPLNWEADRKGSVLENGVVRVPKGFVAAYQSFCEGGWNGMPFDPAYGGQGLPWSLTLAVQEMTQSACMSFGLGPLLTQAAIESLLVHGSEEQKNLYLEPMISGRWSGTMNLTEPQAGSDLSLIRTRAVLDGNYYRISGQKIFITWGDQDCTENIIHMVLARTPDAPPGVKGISLFIVPKILVNPDGSLGARNDLRPIKLEEKLGIHASPTAVMSYGDEEGAVGFLIGEENHGLEYMFVMMNNARLSVGVQGVAIAERAYQQALNYARDRVQGRKLNTSSRESQPIITHPDVRRMLMGMKTDIAAIRGLTYYTAGILDRTRTSATETERTAALLRLELLTPIAKGWATDIACSVASTGVQVHGGMGFIEETGAAQHYRDARILPIYEGTNGIQAADLVGRKLARDAGAEMYRLLDEITCDVTRFTAIQPLASSAACLQTGIKHARMATDWLVQTNSTTPEKSAASATPYMELMGILLGGWCLLRTAYMGGESNQYVALTQFFADHRLLHVVALCHEVLHGSESVLCLMPDEL